ncbi:MAG TPA: cbb3-type cytochrome oxidase assembly protein CcoS [Rubrivivax sp.]|nr:cbb3-type cytochrome oxidase assembly protein CcoS [Burkholderiales bacterium]HNU11566.1 cbb3-type cytochrome oxidase assembly protein CcoS [Rubrivivax sp.]
MSILVVMIPLSILLLIGAGIAFFWAVEHHQFDDLDTPRLLPLLDDPSPLAGTHTESGDERETTVTSGTTAEAPR